MPIKIYGYVLVVGQKPCSIFVYLKCNKSIDLMRSRLYNHAVYPVDTRHIRNNYLAFLNKRFLESFYMHQTDFSFNDKINSFYPGLYKFISL